MALIIGGKETLNPIVAAVVTARQGSYDLVDTESQDSFPEVKNRGNTQFQPGDKVLVLFDDNEQPYIDDIGTSRTGYNFVEITEAIALDGKVVIIDKENAPDVIRTSSNRILVRGSTYRGIDGSPYPTLVVGGTKAFTISPGNMQIRTQDGFGTPYIDFSFEYALSEGDRVYEVSVSSDNGSIQVSDSVSVVKNTVGPEIKSTTFRYPSIQTAVKQGDSVQFIVTTDLETSSVVINSAVFSSNINLTRIEATSTIATWTIMAPINGHINGEYEFSVDAADDLNNHTTRTNQQLQQTGIFVEQNGPSLHIIGVTYPNGQYALKAGENCSIELVVTDFSAIEYSSEYMEILQPTTYEASKVASIRNNTPNGEIPVTVTAHKQSNNSTMQEVVKVLVDSETPAVVIITICRQGEETPALPPILGPGVHQVTFLTNTPLKEAPGIDVFQGFLGPITGDQVQWTADLTIPLQAEGEGYFHNFNLRSCSNMLSGQVTANTHFRIVSALPIVTEFIVTSQHGSLILNGDEVEIAMKIDVSGEHRNSNISIIVDTSVLGGPTELALDILAGVDTIKGFFEAQIEEAYSNATCEAVIHDCAGNTVHSISSPFDVWTISDDYLQQRDHLVRGVNRIGWLQLLAQPAYFSTVAYCNVNSLEIMRPNTLDTENAVVRAGCIWVPSNARARTTYTFLSKKLQFNVALSKSPFIYMDGWNSLEEQEYPEILDLSSYNLGLNDPQISVYVNGNGSDNWALVRDFSRDAPKRRLRTQIDLKATNLYLDNAGIDDCIFFRIDLRTDAMGNAPRVANFGVCYYGLNQG